MTCSSHLTLLHYLNWWTLDTKGPSPVSWPAFELLFMLPAAWKKCWWWGGCWLYGLQGYYWNFHLAMPSLLAYEWFELEDHVTVSFPVLCAMGCRQSLMEDRFNRWRHWENVKITKMAIKFSEDFKGFFNVSKVRLIVLPVKGQKIEMISGFAHQ